MNQIRQAWEDFAAWSSFFWAVLKLLAQMLFYDAMIPDRPYSLTRRLFKGVLWHMCNVFKVPWRESEPIWAGLKGCWGAYSALKQARRDYERLERKLRPLIEQYGEPGETVEQFVERLEHLTELAKIGNHAPLADIDAPAVNQTTRIKDKRA